MNAEESLRQALLAKNNVINEIVRRRELNQPLGSLNIMAKAYQRDIKKYTNIVRRKKK